MKRGDRIELMKKLAKRLSEREWGEVDLILRQFNSPLPHDWESSDRTAYVLWALERTDDEQMLVELHEYLFPSEPVLGQPPPNGHWQPDLCRLFMSHVSAEKALIGQVRTRLRSLGIDGFVAHEDIEPAKEWIHEIEVALETCHALAAFLTPTFHGSLWTDQEIGYCIKRRVLIVPVRMGVDPYGFIGRYQGLTVATPHPWAIADGIFEILAHHELTAPHVVAGLVAVLETADSYKFALSTMALLEQRSHWTPQLLARLEASPQGNAQVANAYGLPARIRALVERRSK
jgi:hypothetical protein